MSPFKSRSNCQRPFKEVEMKLFDQKLLKDAFLSVLEPTKFLPHNMKMKAYWADEKPENDNKSKTK